MVVVIKRNLGLKINRIKRNVILCLLHMLHERERKYGKKPSYAQAAFVMVNMTSNLI